MTEFSNEPMLPASASEMSLVETWMAAITKPQEETFARIAAQPSATIAKAFLWFFISSLLTSFTSLIVQAVRFGRGMGGGFQQFLPPELARELPIDSMPSFGFGTVICGAPVGAIFAVIGFAIFTALVQWVAKLFGGTGSFEKLAYTFSMIAVPVSVVSAVLALVGIIPFIGFLTGLISFGLSIYVLVLEVQAIKAVNSLDTGKAVGALIMPGLVFALFICCCVIIGVAAMGPMIGDVFNEITQGLGGY